jgi:hypothetical protein
LNLSSTLVEGRATAHRVVGSSSAASLTRTAECAEVVVLYLYDDTVVGNPARPHSLGPVTRLDVDLV